MNLETYLNQPGQSGVAFAKLLGVSQPTVSDWVRGKDNGGKVIPEDRARQIERATGGAVTCEEMRPDLVEEFAYMRTRPEPEMTGQAEVQAGAALGFDAMNNEVKAD